MAKRKKAKKTSRRRKVGALSMTANSPLVKFGSIAAGYFLAAKVNDAIDTAIGDKIDGKLVGAGEAGIGLLLLMGKGKKSVAKTAIGGLALGLGANKLLHEFGVLSGFSDMPVLGGYRSVPALNGYNPNPGPGSMGSYRVPRPISQQVMGGISGIGMVDSNSGTGSGLGYMDSDR